jgi:wobble nucleotide-excising tRNase
MLKKLISIKNVGRFRQSAGPAVPELLSNVMVLGASGFGKTTLCAILRSLQTGDVELHYGRRTLGGSGGCTVNLLTSTGNVHFGASRWTTTMPQILIFDSTFVAQNVHAGDVVDLEQKRNLSRHHRPGRYRFSRGGHPPPCGGSREGRRNNSRG